MTTEEALEKITDLGAFEKLVTEVLRAADPAYYRLIHTGVNAQGKTIKAPVDGMVPAGSGQKVIATAYTTTALKSLRNKWLNPSDGDVSKSIKALNEACTCDSMLNAVLVLVANRSPDIELLKNVGEQCAAAGVELDLWERSRLASFLDNNVEGQWLRQKFLGIKAERLSFELLLNLSRKSLNEFARRIPNSSNLTDRKDETKIANRLLMTGLTILSATSGFGKTSVALRIMDTWLQQGRPALWIPETVLEQEISLSSAIHRMLQELHGSALVGTALQVIGTLPFLVVVDDIARINEPARALEKAMAWAPHRQSANTSTIESAIHLLVPTWPEFLMETRQDLAKELGPHIIELETLDLREALKLYRCRLSDTRSTDDEVINIIERLGRDPLLIDLHNLDNPEETPEEIVRLWIERQLILASQQTGAPVQRYKVALRTLAKSMLKTRIMEPSAREVETFFEEAPSHYDDLYTIIRKTSILRWDLTTDQEKMAFRHDRIRDALLTDAMNEFIETEPAEEAIVDPYYADLLGEAIIQRRFDKDSLVIAATHSPLALFAALKRSGRARVSANPSLIASLSNLLGAQREEQTLPDIFFWIAARFLSDTDGLEVEELCSLLPQKSFWIEEALIRNGNVDVALNYMLRHELGTIYPRRERLLHHAANRHPSFVPSVIERLTKTDISSEEKIKSLLLAGFCGCPESAPAIEKCIMQTPLQGSAEIKSAMWAVTQCCSDNLENCIDMVLDAYTGLSPDRSDNASLSEREEVLFDFGGKRIAWDIPKSAVFVIVDQCQKRPDIEKDLSIFLHSVDAPKALIYWVRRRAKTIREDKKAGRKSWGYFFFHNEWRRDLSYRRTMSAESRQALWKIWNNEKEAEEDRLTAFSLWRTQATVVDIPTLKAAPADGKLGENVLQTRVSLGDKSAFATFLKHVEKCKHAQLSFWWQFARGVMDEQLAQGVDQCLSDHSEPAGGDPGFILSELIMELPPELAEPILEKHWENLKSIPEFFQAALFVNTEITRKLAADSFNEISDQHKMFRHLTMHFGFNVTGRSHKTTEEHLKSIEPYLDYMEEQQLFFLWHECNSHKWFTWRRNHLDHRVHKVSDDRLKHDISSREVLLDELCTQEHVWSGWVEHNFLELGYSLDEAFSTISQWAEKRGTETAIKVAADLFFSGANRSHLPMFDRLVAGNSLKSTLQPQVHFGVKYRTLS